MASYETRLRTMYGSEEYKAHNIYPSTNVAFVYAVIAMCLELKEAGYTDGRIIPVVEKCMENRWTAFVKILRFIDRFPFVLQLCVNGINPIMKTGPPSDFFCKRSSEYGTTKYWLFYCVFGLTNYMW